MNAEIPIPKRVRRCEVAILALAEENRELRYGQRAIYEAILLISRRLPENVLGASPASVLMLPPWYENPLTANVLPPPKGLDLQQRGMGTFRFKLTLLTPSEIAEVYHSQDLMEEQHEKLLKREADRQRDGGGGYGGYGGGISG